MEALKIFRAHGIVLREPKISLTIHYHDPEYPHTERVSWKVVDMLIKPGQNLEILKFIKDAVPNNLTFYYVYAYFNEKKLLIFDDSSFICLYTQFRLNTSLKLQGMSMKVYIDHCKP